MHVWYFVLVPYLQTAGHLMGDVINITTVEFSYNTISWKCFLSWEPSNIIPFIQTQDPVEKYIITKFARSC